MAYSLEQIANCDAGNGAGRFATYDDLGFVHTFLDIKRKDTDGLASYIVTVSPTRTVYFHQMSPEMGTPVVQTSSRRFVLGVDLDTFAVRLHNKPHTVIRRFADCQIN